MQVPSTWVDRISDMDPRIVDSYGMVYYVDPDSEYTSAAQEGFAFSRAVQMTVAPTSYTDIASQVVDTFKNNAIFGETTTEDISLNGHKATLIATSIPDDNLAMLTIVSDRDGDGHTAVSLAMNCGPLNGNSHEEVLAAASTWTNQQ